jgi:orotidine-5'-phosphate decarboxylase
MMEAAVSFAPKETRVLGVTLLTSLSEEAARASGWGGGVKATVELLSDLAKQSGLAGVVCSPHEAKKTRSTWGPKAEIVTPGVRLSGAQADDQARSRSPSEAIADGASRIVIGRPILNSADPEAVLESILSDSI